MTAKKDITHNRYGRLTVIIDVCNDKHGNAQWLCLCDCGESKVIVGMNLRKKMTESCGCIHKEAIAKIGKTINLKHGLSYTSKYKTHNTTKYRMRKRKQMPKWADVKKIQEIYANRPDGYDVDHIIPLKGKMVSGLHVENNLQYLTKQENGRKTNFYEVK